MIRELDFKCSECGKKFQPKGKLYYRDEYLTTNIQDTKLICDKCIEAWQEKWQIKSANFHEQDCVMTVDLVLKDATKFAGMDCTPLEENGTVVVGEDIPLTAQKKLFKFYEKWDKKRKKDVLQKCTFEEAFMRTTVSCETYGGEKYEKIAFRINRRGELETESTMPDYIKEQVLEQYAIYETKMAAAEMNEGKTDD